MAKFGLDFRPQSPLSRRGFEINTDKTFIESAVDRRMFFPTVCVVSSARNLGVVIDSRSTMADHVASV